MSRNYFVESITATSPATATTTIHTDSFKNLKRFEWFIVDVELTGATGGTLDIYLQRRGDRDGDVWYDWAHIAQAAAGASKVCYSIQPQAFQGIVTVGTGDATTTTPALTAGVCTGGHPGDELRIVFVAGASTSAGASQVIRLQGLNYED